MTKQHFEKLATALSYSMPESKSPEFKWDQWREDVAVIANACSTINPRFDRERFIAACEGK